MHGGGAAACTIYTVRNWRKWDRSIERRRTCKRASKLCRTKWTSKQASDTEQIAVINKHKPKQNVRKFVVIYEYNFFLSSLMSFLSFRCIWLVGCSVGHRFDFLTLIRGKFMNWQTEKKNENNEVLEGKNNVEFYAEKKTSIGKLIFCVQFLWAFTVCLSWIILNSDCCDTS